MGVMLMDPGYHCPVPITVMEDELSPHSEPYVSVNGPTTKTNSYNFYEKNKDYVIWNSIKDTNGSVKDVDNIILVTKPFLSGLDIAERRNLIYPVKTLLNRDEEGNIKSGFYIVVKPLESAKVTFFHNERDHEHQKSHVPMKYFHRNIWHINNGNYGDLKNNSKHCDGFRIPSLLEGSNSYPLLDCHSDVNVEYEKAVQKVAEDCGRVEEMHSVLSYISEILNDQEFLAEMSKLEQFIYENSKDN